MNATIADGWLNLPISEIADFGSGDSISVARLSERSSASPVPVFGGNGIAGYTSAATTSEPTVILGRVGQKCGVVYQNPGPAWITDNALYVRRYKRPADVRFLALALEVAHLNDVRNRNDLPLITQSILKDVHIAWAESIGEQRRIAETISGAEKTIFTLERLLAKKQLAKQGMMQQLLTGRMRFAGFTGPSVAGTLGDITDVVMGQSPVGTSYNRDGTGDPLINGPTEFTNLHPIPKQWTTAPVRFCEPGDVLICVRGSSTGRINIADRRYCIGRGVAAVRAKGLNDQNYVRYSLSAVVEELLKLQSGSTFPSIDSRVIRGGGILLPEPSEQSVIGEALADADNEIDALRTRLGKARNLKLGMMQQLLTGRIRLPVQETKL